MVSVANTKAYDWGKSGKGWPLVNTDGLSVIEELMPPGTEEEMHSHEICQQFFYILNGSATFIVDAQSHTLNENQGIHIKSGVAHQIRNETSENLIFLVVSQPRSHGDRKTID